MTLTTTIPTLCCGGWVSAGQREHGEERQVGTTNSESNFLIPDSSAPLSMIQGKRPNVNGGRTYRGKVGYFKHWFWFTQMTSSVSCCHGTSHQLLLHGKFGHHLGLQFVRHLGVEHVLGKRCRGLSHCCTCVLSGVRRHRSWHHGSSSQRL
eukprot:scpid58810/ scgid33208/ 